jgi:hypothetical protein
MGDAYTPGLTVTAHTTMRKTRRLPLEGTVVVARGDAVRATQVVARTELPGRVHLVNFANRLGIHPDELESKLAVKPGGAIEVGQLLAESRSFFGLFRNQIHSPIEGTLESISTITGQGILREPPRPVEVTAYIDGEVVEVIENEGVIVEAPATLVQGIFGLGGEVHAPLVALFDRPGQRIEPHHLTAEHQGKIVIGGADITLEGMRRAIELGIAGIVVGGFAYHDIRDLLGYDIGVAVTGTEDIGVTLVVTEGFGHISMAAATFELLCSHAGRAASITGATQIRAGVIRPEVVVPLIERPGEAAAARPDANGESHGLVVGAPVRCIRAPYFGAIGEVTGLPVELQVMPSETRVRVVEISLESGDRVVLPRANVEVIER